MKVILQFGWISLLGLLVISCAKDHTVESWQNEQVAEKLAQISAITGSYNGTMVSTQSGAEMGAVTVKFSSDVRIQDNADRTGTALSPALQAIVTLNGNEKSSIVFQGGFYNAETNYFRINTAIPSEEYGTEKMAISGTISGNILEGEIAALDYPNYAGKFNLVRDADIEPSPATIFSNKIEYFMMTHQRSVTDGRGHVKVETEKVKMAVDSSFLASEEIFIGLFSPIRHPLVTLTFWYGDRFGREVPKSLQEAIYDDRTASLRGKAFFQDAGDTYTTTLDCLRQIESGANGWNCRITNSARGPILAGFFEAISE